MVDVEVACCLDVRWRLAIRQRLVQIHLVKFIIVPESAIDGQILGLN